jgi:chromosome segregation ATPase
MLSVDPIQRTVGVAGEMAQTSVSRRAFVRAGLAAAALVALGGCSMFRRSSDLDTAYSDLQKTLDNLTEDEVRQSRLASIARRIENRCQELTQEHDEFRDRFDSLSRNRDTTSAELVEVVEGFAARRTTQRNELFRLQDELRRELTEEEWDLAVDALAQTQEAYTRPKVSGD